MTQKMGEKEVNKSSLYREILDFPHLELGVVNDAEGLGGGNILGIHRRFLTGDYFYKTGGPEPKETYCHEFGHCLGYWHDGNMTYPQPPLTGEIKRSENQKVGFIFPFYVVYDELLQAEELPFNKKPQQKN